MNQQFSKFKNKRWIIRFSRLHIKSMLYGKIKGLSATRKIETISLLICNTLSATRKFYVGDKVMY
jgi:hypothetical protein